MQLLVRVQAKCCSQIDDVVEEKGSGFALLLCGLPGLGKTRTTGEVSFHATDRYTDKVKT